MYFVSYFYTKLIKNHKYSLIILSHFYSRNKSGSCHSQDTDLTGFHEYKNGSFQVQMSPKSDKFRHGQRMPVENRATFKNSDLDENIIKASKWASASQPWFQTDLGQDADSKKIKISCL